MKRLAAWLVIGLFALQVTGALGLYIHEQSRDMPAAVRVLGSSSPFPGDTAALRIGVYDRHSSRLLALHGVEVAATSAAGVQTARVQAPRDDQSMAVATWVVPDAGEVGLDVHVVAPAIGERNVGATVWPGTGTRWLDDADIMGGEGTPRSVNRSQGGEEPGMSMRAVEDACPWRLHAVAVGGALPRELDASVALRLVDAQGVPQSRVPLTITVRDGDDPARIVTTDASGTALVSADTGWPQTWEMSFPCDGSDVTREARLVPSWDGLQLRPVEFSVRGGRSLTLDVDQQRQRGAWHLDVSCDGRVVWTDTFAIRPGTARIDVPVPAQTSSDAPVRLCAASAYLYPMAPDPPRSVRAFVLRADQVDDAAALRALLVALRERGRAEVRPMISDVLLDAVAGMDASTRRALWAWATSAVEVPYRPMPVLTDDLDERLGAFREAQAQTRARLRMLLGVDALLVLLALAVIVGPSMVRQRRALLETLAEVDEDASDHADVAAPALVMAAFGMTVVVVSLVGLALLLYYLQ